LTYRGPYPTEQLFLALLESFRWTRRDATTPVDVETLADPLAAFMAGGLSWWPAPHTRTFDPRGVYVQSRADIEKLAWAGRSYYRADWQGVERHTSHRLHEVGDRVVGGLWGIGAPLEEHMVLTSDGTVLSAALPPADEGPMHLAAPTVTA